MHEVKREDGRTIALQFHPAHVQADLKALLDRSFSDVGLGALDSIDTALDQEAMETEIKDFINQEQVPKALYPSLIQGMASKLLRLALSKTHVVAEGTDGLGEIKSMSEGDVSYTFATSAEQAKGKVQEMDRRLEHLEKGREQWWRYRSIAW